MLCHICCTEACSMRSHVALGQSRFQANPCKRWHKSWANCTAFCLFVRDDEQTRVCVMRSRLMPSYASLQYTWASPMLNQHDFTVNILLYHRYISIVPIFFVCLRFGFSPLTFDLMMLFSLLFMWLFRYACNMHYLNKNYFALPTPSGPVSFTGSFPFPLIIGTVWFGSGFAKKKKTCSSTVTL